MHLSWVSWHREIYYVRPLIRGRFQNLKGGEKACQGKEGGVNERRGEGLGC